MPRYEIGKSSVSIHSVTRLCEKRSAPGSAELQLGMDRYNAELERGVPKAQLHLELEFSQVCHAPSYRSQTEACRRAAALHLTNFGTVSDRKSRMQVHSLTLAATFPSREASAFSPSHLPVAVSRARFISPLFQPETFCVHEVLPDHRIADPRHGGCQRHGSQDA